MKRLSKEQKVLLELLGAALFGKEPQIPEGIDWPAVAEEAMTQAVLPLAVQAMGERIPEELRAKFAEKADAAIIHNMSMEWEHITLHEWLSEAEIPYVILKGSASAAWYPTPMLRMMGDVDFLVDPKDEARAAALLGERGFIRGDVTPEDVSYFRKNPDGELVEFELHHSVKGIPAGTAGERTAACLADLIGTALLHETENGSYRIPDAFHHGLILLLHTANPMINSGVGLRHLCDWAVFVNRFSPEDFCALFEEKLRTIGLWRFACLLTALCTETLGSREQPWAALDAEPELLEAMREDIFAAGNFGGKDEQRLNQAKLMTDKSKGGVDDTGMLRQLVLTMNEKARRAMPAAEKVPALLPAGWIYAGGRHLVRIALGKSPRIKLKETVEGAAERREIYRRFHLFETE